MAFTDSVDDTNAKLRAIREVLIEMAQILDELELRTKSQEERTASLSELRIDRRRLAAMLARL